MGTINLWWFWSAILTPGGDGVGIGDRSSGGISSGAGIGRLLRAATSWCSVQESE